MALIEVRNIEKVYGEGDATTRALRGVSFDIAEGEFIAIMGPSGSGKSTLLHILGLLDRPTTGSYRFGGKNIDTYSEDELAQFRNERVGFVFQQFNLLARTTVYENVRLPLIYSDVPERAWDALVRSAIERVGLMHRAKHSTAQLSGGEQQRTAIARALVRSPKVIFADEPTGNLDSKSGRLIMETIEDLYEQGGQTVILITHEHTTAAHAHRILHLKDGALDSDEQVANPQHARDGYIK
ncbi:MAG: ABC transporter ATP-binding protein [Candidatus Uhrbacteria bacterium]